MSTRIITDNNGRKHITNEPLLHQPAPVPTSWMEMVTVNLLREGVNKHKARELAEHFYGLAPAQPAPVQEMTNIQRHEQNVQKFLAAQPAVPDALFRHAPEHPQYIEGWNDCRAEMLKGMK